MPISATAIREDPWANWRYLGPGVRAWYARRVCLMGAESTGKTTLAEALARVYDTVWVPEYGRPYTVSKNKTGEPWTTEDFIRIARRQQADEDEAARAREPHPVLRHRRSDDSDLARAIPGPTVTRGRNDRRRRSLRPHVPHGDRLPVDRGQDPELATRSGSRCSSRFSEVLRDRPEPVLELRGTLDERTATAVEAIDQHLGLRPAGLEPAVAVSGQRTGSVTFVLWTCFAASRAVTVSDIVPVDDRRTVKVALSLPGPTRVSVTAYGLMPG